MEIRKIRNDDLQSLLALYTQLHGNTMPEINPYIYSVFNHILADKNHHILVGFYNNKLICSCVVVIVFNLTHNQRPYALIENVITDEQHRNKGYATAILNFAKEIAMQENCYKIMLMTSSKKNATVRFYEKSGYNRHDKTAFVQWL